MSISEKNMDTADLLKSFLEEEGLKRRPRGVSHLRNKVPKFFSFLEEQEIRVKEVRVKEALAYRSWLCCSKSKGGKKYDKKTINDYLISVSSLFDYLKIKGIVYCNPFREIKKLRIDKTLPKNIPKEAEMAELLNTLCHYDVGKTLKEQISLYKVHLVCELMYSTGLRIAEVADLKVSDIDFDRGIVYVREGKFGLSRTAFLNEYTGKILKLYIERVRPAVFSEWNKRNGNSLFGIKWDFLNHIVNKYLKQTTEVEGMERITTKGFRHSLGYHLLRAGCNIRYIQSILGHRKLHSTEIYTKVDKEELKEVIDTYHPRNRFMRIGNET